MSDNKFKQGKIYTIRCYDKPEYLYIVSTIRDLKTRFSAHKSSIKQAYCKSKLYKCMRTSDNLDWWYTELYENFPCENSKHLRNREYSIINELKPSLNTNPIHYDPNYYR